MGRSGTHSPARRRLHATLHPPASRRPCSAADGSAARRRNSSRIRRRLAERAARPRLQRGRAAGGGGLRPLRRGREVSAQQGAQCTGNLCRRRRARLRSHGRPRRRSVRRCAGDRRGRESTLRGGGGSARQAARRRGAGRTATRQAPARLRRDRAFGRGRSADRMVFSRRARTQGRRSRDRRTSRAVAPGAGALSARAVRLRASRLSRAEFAVAAWARRRGAGGTNRFPGRGRRG